MVGVETDRALARLVAGGVAKEIAEELLAACEKGFVRAMNERDGDGSD